MILGESLTPWLLLIEEELYLPSGPYLGQITSGEQVGPQNEKHPSRVMQNYLRIGKWPVTLHKTKVKQMTSVGNACISYTQTSPKEVFVTKNVLFLLICLHFHLIDQIRKPKFVGEGISSVSLTWLWMYF